MRLGLFSPALEEAGFRNAFFTRSGGVSEPPWDTLNFSATTGDAEAAVRVNLQRAAAELGVAVGQVYFASQVHGCDSRLIGGDEDRRQVMLEQGDITLAARAGIACAVRTADCPAVLLADRRSGAVAAIHSGWRGTVKGVVSAGVRDLRELIGGAGQLVAAVGPHIEQCCFEVGEDVAAQLADASALGTEVVDDQPRPHVDLRRIIDAQLKAEGVADVDHVAGCTMCERERFHSYRRDGPRSGRMLAAVVAGGQHSKA